MTDPTIHLRAAGDGYAVSVEPPVTGFDFDLATPDLRYARTFARGVKRHRGFPLVDHTEAAHG